MRFYDSIGDTFLVVAVLGSCRLGDTIVTVERGQSTDDDIIIEQALDEWEDAQGRAVAWSADVEFVVEPHEEGVAISVPIR